MLILQRRKNWDVFKIPSLDYLGFDDYGKERNHNITVRSTSVEKVLTNYDNLNEHKKPVELMEVGHGGHHAPDMYLPSNMHNSYWSSAFSGAMGPGSMFYAHYYSDIGLKAAESENGGSVYSTLTNNYTDAINGPHVWENNAIAKNAFWASYYLIPDIRCSERLDLSGASMGSLNITPDFTHHLRTLRDFMNITMVTAGIDLQEAYTPQRYPSNDPTSTDITNTTYTNTTRLEAFILVNDNKSDAVGWVHNRSDYWGNYDFFEAYNDGYNECTSNRTIPGFEGFNDSYSGDCVHPTYTQEMTSGEYLYVSGSPQDDDNTDILDLRYGGLGLHSFTVSGLENNEEYEVRWYNTLQTTTGVGNPPVENTSPPGSPDNSNISTDGYGVLTIETPEMWSGGDADWAFIISKDGTFNKLGLLQEELAPKKEVNSRIKVVPNPNKGAFNLYLDEGYEGQVQIQIFNTIGAVVYQKNSFRY